MKGKVEIRDQEGKPSYSFQSSCQIASLQQSAAQDHPVILVFGLGLSIALMGIAASFIARLLQRHHWIAYVGLAVILYVAVEMIYRGALEVWPLMS